MIGAKIDIRIGSTNEAVALSKLIPEFDQPYTEQEYERRFKNKKHLIAIATIEEQAVGFKVGYDWQEDKTFYTWMGGVLPKFRKLGIAKLLAEFQEKYVIEEGFHRILLKTRNMHKNMLIFAIRSGFEILKVEVKSKTSENRILLCKTLLDEN